MARWESFPSSGTQGFGLLEVAIAGAILSLTALGFAELMHRQSDAVLGNRVVIDRDALVDRLLRISGDANSLNVSALNPANGGGNQFHDCAVGGAAATSCTASPGGLDMTLFDPMGVEVAGPPANPQYYDLSGARCVPTGPTDNRCAIQAISTYGVNCGGGQPQCQIGKSLSVSYTVQQKPGIILAAGPSLKPVTQSMVSELPLVLTTTGTPGTIAKWITSNQLGDSVLSEVAGNVGVGTTTPVATLDVNGSIRLGPDPRPCTPALAGVMQWSGTQFLACDGTNWLRNGPPEANLVSTATLYTYISMNTPTWPAGSCVAILSTAGYSFALQSACKRWCVAQVSKNYHMGSASECNPFTQIAECDCM